MTCKTVDTVLQPTLFEIQTQIAPKLYAYVRFYYLYKKFNKGKITKIGNKVYDCLHVCPVDNNGNRPMSEGSIVRNLQVYGFKPTQKYLLSQPYEVPSNVDVDCVRLYRFVCKYIEWLANKLSTRTTISADSVRRSLSRLYSEC